MAVKRKIGTTLDATLYQRAKEMARRQGRSFNEVLGEALERFLAAGASGASVVAQTRGTFQVSKNDLRAVLEEDVYGVD